MHRHEPAVPADPVTVVHEDAQVLVVSKPAGMPVHPCGRYRHNTVLGVLGHTQGHWNLCVTHRLDRPTSGVLLLAKTPAAAAGIRDAMVAHQVSKTYLARVRGRFPDTAACDLNILVSQARIGICRVDKALGKPAQTAFTRLAYDSDSDSSLVRCLPKTGRMHQIRVHLQCLGHPIVDDTIYTRPEWGSHTGLAATDAVAARVADAVERDMRASGADGEDDAQQPLPSEMSSLEPLVDAEGNSYLCSHCARAAAAAAAGGGGPGQAEANNTAHMMISLHAETYEGPGWRYTAPRPLWAHFAGAEAGEGE